MLEPLDPERLRGVTRLARRSELPSVRVGVARRAVGFQPAEVEGQRRVRARSFARRRLAMTGSAREGQVLAFEREARLCGVIERNAAEPGLLVAVSAILTELASMRVPVTPGAWPHRELHLRCRVHMASSARHPTVLADERRARARVVERADLPTRCAVTFLAVVRERRIVRALVAVRTRLEPESLEHLIHVALRAGDIPMRAIECEARLRVVERFRRLLERGRDGMATRAVRAEDALVRIGMTGGAARAESQV